MFISAFIVFSLTLITVLTLTQRIDLCVHVAVAIVASAGLCAQAGSLLGAEWNAKSLIAITVLFCPIWIFLISRVAKSSAISKEDNFASVFGLIVPSLLIIALIVLSRLFAENQTPHQFTTLNYFGGEDNAHWMFMTSQLLNDSSLDFNQVGITGIFSIFLILVIGFVQILQLISFGSINSVPNQIIDVVATSSLALLALAPLSLVGQVRKIVRSTRYTQSLNLLLGAITVSTSAAALVAYGHLSLMFVMGLSVLCISILGNPDYGPHEKYIGIFLMGAVSSSWLGLHLLPIFLLISLLILPTSRKRILSLRTWRLSEYLLAFGILISLTVPIQAIKYFSDVVSFDEILSAPGGVLALSSTRIILAAMALIIFAMVFNYASATDRTSIGNFLITTFVIYVLCVLLLDQWRTGLINYGSVKITYLTGTVLFSALLPLIMNELTRINRKLFGLSFSFATFCAVLLMYSAEGVTNPLFLRMKSEQWPSEFAVIDNSWRAVVSNSLARSKNLSELPIGCVVAQQDGSIAMNFESYLCTRYMLSITGEFENAGRFFYWSGLSLNGRVTDVSSSSRYQPINRDLIRRNVILMDPSTQEVLDSRELSSLTDLKKVTGLFEK